MTEVPHQPDPADEEGAEQDASPEETPPQGEPQVGSGTTPTPGGYKGDRDPKEDMPHMPSRPDAPEEDE